MSDGQLGLTYLLSRSARRDPDKLAIVCGGKAITFAQLEQDVCCLAGALQQRGVKRGDRVAIRLHNREEVICTYFAAHALGAICVPLNMRLSDDETAHIINDAQPHLIVAETESLAATWAANVPHWLCVDKPFDADDSFDRARRCEVAVQDPGGGDDPAFIMYTSGTTGWPKGAVLTHQNLFVNACSWALEVGVTRDDVWASPLPLFHIGGVVGVYPFLMLSGATHILPSIGFDAHTYLQAITASGATMCALVPSQWDLVTQNPDAARLLAGIRRAVWGAAPASIKILERMEAVLPTGSIMCTFGQTEVTANATFLPPHASRTKIGSAGRPAMAVECRIINDAGHDVPAGEIGEIAYRGPTVMAGYWNKPEATVEAFVDGWFCSGDLVRVDADGFIYIVDRKKDMLISGGENVYPAEVERVLAEYPGVSDIAVVGVPDERWGEVPIAYAVLAVGVEPDMVLQFAKTRMAAYKIPRQLLPIDVLPRNAAGKVRKNILRAAWAQTIPDPKYS